MAKNIVILNGSPRVSGNTAALVQAFTDGAESAGHKVTTFLLDQMDINGCKGCCCGKNTEKMPCVQKDDMAKIYPAVKESDVVVFASPLYYWNLSGQLRTATDRLFALEEGEKNLLRGNGRSCALLMAAAGSDFDDAVTYYDNLTGHLEWKNLGHIAAGGNWGAGDIADKKELLAAYDLGASIK